MIVYYWLSATVSTWYKTQAFCSAKERIRIVFCSSCVRRPLFPDDPHSTLLSTPSLCRDSATIQMRSIASVAYRFFAHTPQKDAFTQGAPSVTMNRAVGQWKIEDRWPPLSSCKQDCGSGVKDLLEYKTSLTSWAGQEGPAGRGTAGWGLPLTLLSTDHRRR